MKGRTDCQRSRLDRYGGETGEHGTARSLQMAPNSRTGDRTGDLQRILEGVLHPGAFFALHHGQPSGEGIARPPRRGVFPSRQTHPPASNVDTHGVFVCWENACSVDDRAVDPSRSERRSCLCARSTNGHCPDPSLTQQSFHQLEPRLTSGKYRSLPCAVEGRELSGLDDTVRDVPSVRSDARCSSDDALSDKGRPHQGSVSRWGPRDDVHGPCVCDEQIVDVDGERRGQGQGGIHARQMPARLDGSHQLSAHPGADGECRLGEPCCFPKHPKVGAHVSLEI